jgi:hypothetical protein
VVVLVRGNCEMDGMEGILSLGLCKREGRVREGILMVGMCFLVILGV